MNNTPTNSPFDGLFPVKLGTLTTPDGAKLAYQVFGDGYPLVFGNGIGVSFPGLSYQIGHLRDRYQVVCWDYRGIRESTVSGPSADLSMETHARDMLAVLDSVGAKDAVLFGWSMGVQVSLEVYRMAPERVRGIVAIAGTFGRPFSTTILRAPGIEKIILGAIQIGHTLPWMLDVIMGLAVRVPITQTVLRSIRFMNGKADPRVMASNIQGIADVDKRLYMRTMKQLGLHDARDLLPAVKCPVLILAGEKDTVTPPDLARQMAEKLPNAELVVMKGASHFNLIEDPHFMNTQIDRFLNDLLISQQS